MKKIVLFTLVLVSLLTAACGGTAGPAEQAEPTLEEPQSNAVTAEGRLIPATSVELAFAQGGVVKTVFVQAGEKVSAGEVIARLSGSETVQAELSAARLEQTLAQQSLDALRRNALRDAAQTEQSLLDAQKAYERAAGGWNPGNIQKASELELTLDDYVQAEVDTRKAREKLESLMDKEESNRERRDAQEDLESEEEALAETYADLLASAAENDRPLDEKLTALLIAVGDLETARAAQARLDGSNLDPETLAAAEARLEAARAHVAASETALELYELRAPFSGVLFSLDLKPGEAVTPLLPVGFLADSSRWTVETKDLAEIFVAEIAVGNPVSVQLDAFPNQAFTGSVTEIDPIGSEYLGDMTYTATITLAETDPRFLWNMTATVTIEEE